MILYIDTETTGLDDRAEVIEVAILDEVGSVLLDTLVQCEEPIPPAASKIHGLTEEDLRQAPQWPEVHAQVAALLSTSTQVRGYNIAFDLRLLHQTAARHLLLLPTVSSLCVMRQVAAGGSWCSLSEACASHGVTITGAHRALADCQATRLLDLACSQTRPQRRS